VQRFDDLKQIKTIFEKKKCLKCGSYLKVNKKQIYCEQCNVKVNLVYLEIPTRADLKLSYQGAGLYALSQRIDPTEWKKVAKFFRYYHGDSGEDEDSLIEMYNVRGWATKCVKEVEEILKIPYEHSIEAREQKAKIAKEQYENGKRDAMKVISAEIQKIRTKYHPLFADWSWDDFSQEVGGIIECFDNFDVYEYCVNKNKIGYTLKRKNLAEKYKIAAGRWADPLAIMDSNTNSNAEILGRKLMNSLSR
jgi:hypothetical protein